MRAELVEVERPGSASGDEVKENERHEELEEPAGDEMEWQEQNSSSTDGRVHAQRQPLENGQMINGAVNGHAAGDRAEAGGERRRQAPPPADEPTTAPHIECADEIRVLTQVVTIDSIDFVEESFRVHTDLIVAPIVSNLTAIPLHLGNCALLPNEADFFGTVAINDIEASYTRINAFKDLLADVKNPAIGQLSSKLYEAYTEKDYQLLVSVPEELRDTVAEQHSIKLSIDVLVKKPKHGVQFSHTTGMDGVAEKGAHLFTYRSSFMSGAREWLPCRDAPDQLSLWKIKIICDASHTAIASAELVDVELTEDLEQKVYHFQQSIPTAACSIGFVVGQFTPVGHPDVSEVTSFALPGLVALVKHTTFPVGKIMEYLEELLSCRFPYPSYKIVFVDKIPDEVTVYAGLSLFSVNVLYHKKIIDVVQESRQLLASGVAQQFFGSFITPSHWVDWWLIKSMARLITSFYTEKVFGASELLFQLRGALRDVTDYEFQWGKVVLRPRLTHTARLNLHFDPRNERTCSPLYADALAKKGHIVLRMLYKRLGHELFFQVLQKILTVAQQMSGRRDKPVCWTHLVISTESFFSNHFRTLMTVSGQEMRTFQDYWIYEGGHVALQVSFQFNRKRNIIEIECKQDTEQGNGRMRYLGPLTVVVQELDGSFTHTVQIDSDISRSELQCHSKGRRQKRKKVPFHTGEEVEIDLTNMDQDSPVLWLRVDPDMMLLCNVFIHQPAFHWEYMLKYERDVLAQFQALERLQQFPSAQSRNVLMDTITNQIFYYRVRCRAAHVLTSIMSRMTESWAGTPVLITLFREKYGSQSQPAIPKSNNFVATSANLQAYFLMQALPQAVANLRMANGMCVREVEFFIMSLIKFNDNSINRYSDDHYRACLISALASTLVPVQTLGGGTVQMPDQLSPEMKAILKELTQALNMDTLKPSFGRVVGIAALNGLYQMQRHGHLPSDTKLFWKFAAPKICVQMRKAAISIIADRVSSIKDQTSAQDLLKLYDMAQSDSDPTIRYLIPTLLSHNPPFATYNNNESGQMNPCNTTAQADKLWAAAVNYDIDSRTRLLFLDVYFSMFGLGIPPIKGGPPHAGGHHRAYSHPDANAAANHSSAAMSAPSAFTSNWIEWSAAGGTAPIGTAMGGTIGASTSFDEVARQQQRMSHSPGMHHINQTSRDGRISDDILQ